MRIQQISLKFPVFQILTRKIRDRTSANRRSTKLSLRCDQYPPAVFFFIKHPRIAHQIALIAFRLWQHPFRMLFPVDSILADRDTSTLCRNLRIKIRMTSGRIKCPEFLICPNHRAGKQPLLTAPFRILFQYLPVIRKMDHIFRF